MQTLEGGPEGQAGGWLCWLTHHFYTAFHVEGYQARVMVGGASDARHVTPKQGDIIEHAVNVDSQCGHPGPTRTRVTFECFRASWRLEMRWALERRLLLPLRPPPPTWGIADYEAGIVEVADYLGTLDQELLARGGEPWQRASWAVAFQGASFKGLVQGPEQTPAESERVAVLLLCEALDGVFGSWQTTSVWLDDSGRAKQRVRKVMRGSCGDASLWQYLGWRWRGFRRAAGGLTASGATAHVRALLILRVPGP